METQSKEQEFIDPNFFKKVLSDYASPVKERCQSCGRRSIYKARLEQMYSPSQPTTPEELEARYQAAKVRRMVGLGLCRILTTQRWFFNDVQRLPTALLL